MGRIFDGWIRILDLFNCDVQLCVLVNLVVVAHVTNYDRPCAVLLLLGLGFLERLVLRLLNIVLS